MTRRPLVALATAAAAALALGGAPALAAPAKACRLLVDEAGDAAVAGQNRPAIDIVSGDVASGPRNLVGVLRVASLASDPLLAAGSTYSLGWRLGTTPQAFSLTRYQDGTSVASFDPDASFGASGDERDVTALLDPAGGTITWTLPRKSNAALKPRAKFSALEAGTQAATNVRTDSVTFSGSFLGGDDASGSRGYVDGAPTCVKGV